MLETEMQVGALAQPFPGGLPPWKQLTLMSGVGIWPEAEKAGAEPTQHTTNKDFRVMRVKQIRSKTQPDPEGNYSAEM